MTHELPNESEPELELWSVRRGPGVGPGTLWFGALLFALVMSARGAEPEIAVSVNGRDSAVVFPGMPLLISAVFVSSGAADCSVPPVLLAAGSGPWTNAVTLEIRNAAGALQSWSLHTAITPSNSITLDCAAYAGIDWWLTPAETSLLSIDSYTIDLVLNTTDAVLPGAWRGVSKALPAQVTLMPESGPLSEAQAENKYTQLGEYYLFVPSPLDALNQANQLLTLYPSNIAGLRLKAEALDSLGRVAEALAACEQALKEVYSRNPNPMEPPRNLFDLRRRLQDELQPAVLGRYVFYNQSAFDGNDPTANALDDGAIAIDKRPLLPGQTASFANYTSYSKGINGIMIDIAGLAGTPTASDFIFKTGNSADVATWTTAPAPLGIYVRPGAGIDGSSRVTILWPNNAIQKQWLQVTVLARAATGLAAPDLFYFGNAIGESGNSAAEARVNATDEIIARNNARATGQAPIDFRYDYNRDGKVNATDEIIARNNATSSLTALHLFTAPGATAASTASFGPTTDAVPGAFSGIATDLDLARQTAKGRVPDDGSPPLRITNVSIAAGKVTLRLETQPGRSYTLQSSTNLINWRTVELKQAHDVRLDFLDPSRDGSPYRYYRAVVVP